MSEGESQTFHSHTRAESVPMRQRQRDHVPVPVRAVQMHRAVLLARIAGQRQRSPGFDRLINICGQAGNVILGQQGDSHVGKLGIRGVAAPITIQRPPSFSISRRLYFILFQVHECE